MTEPLKEYAQFLEDQITFTQCQIVNYEKQQKPSLVEQEQHRHAAFLQARDRFYCLFPEFNPDNRAKEGQLAQKAQ